MFKTTIMDSIKKLVKGDGAGISDKPDQRIQKIHLLLDNAEKNIDISGEKNPPKTNASAAKQPDFGREAYHENLARLEKEIFNISAMKNAKRARPKHNNISAEVSDLAKELDAIKRALLDYGETTEVILRGMGAEKIPELEKLGAHDKEINSIKSELLKSVRITDAVTSDKKELEKRIKKIESAQIPWRDSESRIRQIVDDAVKNMPAQRDYSGMNNSVTELKKGLLELKGEIEATVEEFPENLMQLKKEVSKLKDAQMNKSVQSPETERLSGELNYLEKELEAVKKALIDYGEKISSFDSSISAKKIPELKMLRTHDKELIYLKSEILKSARIKDDVASERKEFDKRLKKVESAQTSEIEYNALIQNAVDAAMREIHLQKDHKGIKGSISELRKAVASKNDDFDKRIKKIEGLQSTRQDFDARVQKAVGAAIGKLRDDLDAELANYPENLAKLKAEVSKLKETQKIRDLRSLKEGKNSSEMFAMAKELAIVKKTLLEHSETIESILTDIAAANEAVGQNRMILESIPAEISNAKNDELVARENAKALLEEEISGMREDLGGIKGIVESLKNAKKAKTKKAKKHAVHKHHKPRSKNDGGLRRHFKGGLLQTLREYTNEETLRAPNRRKREVSRTKQYHAKPTAIRAAANKSSNPEYIELKLAIENKSRELKIHRQNNKQNHKRRGV